MPRAFRATGLTLLGFALVSFIHFSATAQEARSLVTYRSEVLGRVGVVGEGRRFAAEVGMRIFSRSGNALEVGLGKFSNGRG